jgi:hypothetical protein
MADVDAIEVSLGDLGHVPGPSVHDGFPGHGD